MTLMHSDPTGDRVVRLEEMEKDAPISEDQLDTAPSATGAKTVRKVRDSEKRNRAKAASARTVSRAGMPNRPSCYEIAVANGKKEGCGHKKHSMAKGRRK